MSTILDRFTDTAQQVPIHPAGPAATAAPATPPQLIQTLPAPAPCGATGPLNLFADPADQARLCGCPLFWVDTFGNVHCQACRPPLRTAMVRHRLVVVVLAGGFAWEDLDTRERLTCENGAPAAASDPAAYPVLAKMLDDGKSAWLVIQRRDRECTIPIEMSIDEWWQANAGRQAGAEAARRIAANHAVTAFGVSRQKSEQKREVIGSTERSRQPIAHGQARSLFECCQG